MNLREQYKEYTGKDWYVFEISHSEKAHCSNDYMLWLEEELLEARVQLRKIKLKS